MTAASGERKKKRRAAWCARSSTSGTAGGRLLRSSRIPPSCRSRNNRYGESIVRRRHQSVGWLATIDSRQRWWRHNKRCAPRRRRCRPGCCCSSASSAAAARRITNAAHPIAAASLIIAGAAPGPLRPPPRPAPPQPTTPAAPKPGRHLRSRPRPHHRHEIPPSPLRPRQPLFQAPAAAAPAPRRPPAPARCTPRTHPRPPHPPASRCTPPSAPARPSQCTALRVVFPQWSDAFISMFVAERTPAAVEKKQAAKRRRVEDPHHAQPLLRGAQEEPDGTRQVRGYAPGQAVVRRPHHPLQRQVEARDAGEPRGPEAEAADAAVRGPRPELRGVLGQGEGGDGGAVEGCRGGGAAAEGVRGQEADGPVVRGRGQELLGAAHGEGRDARVVAARLRRARACGGSGAGHPLGETSPKTLRGAGRSALCWVSAGAPETADHARVCPSSCPVHRRRPSADRIILATRCPGG